MAPQADATRGSLLLIAPIMPANRGNGLAMRIAFFLAAYLRRFDVDLAVFPVAGEVAGTGHALDGARRVDTFSPQAIDAHFALVKAVSDPDARLAAFRRYGRPSLASVTGAASREALMRWIGASRYDVVHVARLYLAPLVQPLLSITPSRPRLVLDCDEDDARAYRRLALLERRQGRRGAADWAEAEADAFARLAADVLPWFDDVLVSSWSETAALAMPGVSLTVVPNVAPFDARPVPRSRKPRIGTVLFVGTMGYAPNDDGARWFITRVWARLRQASRSPLQLVLAGTNPTAALVRLGRRHDIVVTGAVPDVSPYYRAADLVVIPLRTGGGTRIKLLEAAARGVPVVSTTLGAEGTTFRHGRDLLLADTEERLAGACASVLRRRRQAQRMAARARLRIRWDYERAQWFSRVDDLMLDRRQGEASVEQAGR
jgi:glycosyltransferase involved in cell wall biosynthesis